MIENLKENLEHQNKILQELIGFSNKLEKIKELEKKGISVDKREKKILEESISSLLNQIKIINKSVPSIVKEIKIIKQFPQAHKKKEFVKVSYNHLGKERARVTIKDTDRKRFLEELSLTNRNFEKIKKREKQEDILKPKLYVKISNKFFSSLSRKLVEKGYFKNLSLDLKKANLPYILESYISMIFFSTFLAFVLGIVSSIILFVFFQNMNYFFLIPGLPILAFVSFYLYPISEKKSIENRINQELPFVVIHMSAIASSKIEPSSIFKIIAENKEYKYVSPELKKIINQVNLYGLDLVTALRNSAKNTSSVKLGELFTGIATNISTGGSLTNFFSKRAETLLLDYKLERERYTKSVDTFMNVYIAVVIAAPFIMMMLLILLNVTNITIGMSIKMLSFIMVSAVSFINIIFIMFLSLRQPKY